MVRGLIRNQMPALPVAGSTPVPSADNRCQTMTNPLPRKGFCFALSPLLEEG